MTATTLGTTHPPSIVQSIGACPCYPNGDAVIVNNKCPCVRFWEVPRTEAKRKKNLRQRGQRDQSRAKARS